LENSSNVQEGRVNIDVLSLATSYVEAVLAYILVAVFRNVISCPKFAVIRQLEAEKTWRAKDARRQRCRNPSALDRHRGTLRAPDNVMSSSYPQTVIRLQTSVSAGTSVTPLSESPKKA
jgi:hypothetical protein